MSKGTSARILETRLMFSWIAPLLWAFVYNWSLTNPLARDDRQEIVVTQQSQRLLSHSGSTRSRIPRSELPLWIFLLLLIFRHLCMLKNCILRFIGAFLLCYAFNHALSHFIKISYENPSSFFSFYPPELSITAPCCAASVHRFACPVRV